MGASLMGASVELTGVLARMGPEEMCDWIRAEVIQIATTVKGGLFQLLEALETTLGIELCDLETYVEGQEPEDGDLFEALLYRFDEGRDTQPDRTKAGLATLAEYYVNAYMTVYNNALRHDSPAGSTIYYYAMRTWGDSDEVLDSLMVLTNSELLDLPWLTAEAGGGDVGGEVPSLRSTHDAALALTSYLMRGDDLPEIEDAYPDTADLVKSLLDAVVLPTPEHSPLNYTPKELRELENMDGVVACDMPVHYEDEAGDVWSLVWRRSRRGANSGNDE